jgi:hypothetical protein
MGDATAKPARRRRRWLAPTLIALGLVVCAGAAVRAALPGWVRTYVNQTLDRGADFSGDVGDIDIHLWRGAYAINDVRITKRRRSVPVPFFECPRVEFSIDWRALTHGTVRGDVKMERPRLNFVAGPTKADEQTGVNEPWLSIMEDLFPFRIDRAEVVDGAVHFHTFHTSPKVNVFISDLEATLENLSNVEEKTDPRPAALHAKGVAMHSGRVRLDMTLDPHAHRPTFDMAAEVLDLDVTKLNALTRAFGDFDFSEGKFDLVVEAEAHEGAMEGYAKPLFRNLTVVDLRDVRDDDPLQLLWETLVGVAGTVFKNQPRDQFGTRFEFQGSMDDPQTNLLEIVGNVLYNAFVRAYLPRVEGRIAPGRVSERIEQDSHSGTGRSAHER